MSSARTLWEEGRTPGRLVAIAAVLLLLVTVIVDLLLTERLTLFFDLTFVTICVAAALAVRPRDFFVIGVFPPLLMAGTALALTLLARDAIADPGDGPVQGWVSGLAHHAGALVAGYALTLVILSLRQLARRNAGSIRSGHRPAHEPAHEPVGGPGL